MTLGYTRRVMGREAPANDRWGPPAPPWVWWTLLVGAAILVAWAWFVLGFLAEPSAVGRSRVALNLVGGSSLGAALLGVAAAIALRARRRWAPSLAFVAAGFMILTLVGAVAGIPAVIGLASSRTSSRN